MSAVNACITPRSCHTVTAKPLESRGIVPLQPERGVTWMSGDGTVVQGVTWMSQPGGTTTQGVTWM